MNLFGRQRTAISKSLWILGMLLTLLASCNKSAIPDPGSDPEEYIEQKGFGHSTEEPEGTPFSLPEGITLVREMIGYMYIFPDSCEGVSWEHMKSEGMLVAVCLGLKNNTSSPITVTLPPGLILRCNNTKIQNGIIAERIVIEVPAQQQLFTPVGAYCLNGDRPFGNGPSLTFTFGPVTTYKPMLDFFELLQTKNKRPEAQPNPEYSGYIQSCIWDIANTGRISDLTMELFNKIPDK